MTDALSAALPAAVVRAGNPWFSRRDRQRISRLYQHLVIGSMTRAVRGAGDAGGPPLPHEERHQVEPVAGSVPDPMATEGASREARVASTNRLEGSEDLRPRQLGHDYAPVDV